MELIDRTALLEKSYFLGRPATVDHPWSDGAEVVDVEDIEAMPVIGIIPIMHGQCPYCDSDNNDYIPLNQSVEYSGIEMAINRQGMLRVRYYMHNGIDNFESQDIIQIKHCPNCGAKMRLEE